ncbi:hypothetical protein HK097_005472, partial [Rhizophlyctis rosea]
RAHCCKLCTARFRRPQELRRHERSVHKDRLGVAAAPAGGGSGHDGEHLQSGVHGNGEGGGSESAGSAGGVNMEWSGSAESGRSRQGLDIGYNGDAGSSSSFRE